MVYPVSESLVLVCLIPFIVIWWSRKSLEKITEVNHWMGGKVLDTSLLLGILFLTFVGLNFKIGNIYLYEEHPIPLELGDGRCMTFSGIFGARGCSSLWD